MNTSLVVQTAPTTTAVTLPSMQDHLRIDELKDSDKLLLLIKAATDRVQVFLRKQLITATYRAKFDTFPVGDIIRLDMPPLQSVTSIAYVDTSGATQTFASGSYNVHTDPTPGYVELGYGQEWPTTRDQSLAVTIVYLAGYGTTEDKIPEDIKNGIREYVGHLYENREGDGGDLPDATKNLLRGERWFEFA